MKAKFLLIFLVFSNSVLAMNFNVNDISFGINGYLDSEADWMEEMVMAMSCTASNPCSMSGMNLTSGEMIMEMPESYRMSQNHLNIILSAQKDAVRTNINLESRYSYQSNDRFTGSSSNEGESGRFGIAEAYGEYTASTSLRYRFGSFYTPFGIYNQYRYITPLFATVVLPFIYELPLNYNGSIIVPSNSNFMISGELLTQKGILSYYLYTGTGKRNQNSNAMADNGVGRESDNDKSIGARFDYEIEDSFSIGTSFYHVHDAAEESKKTYGIDLDIFLPENLRLKTELVLLRQLQDKTSYYFNLSYEGHEKLVPFIMYDYFKDESDTLYKFGHNRIGFGCSYAFKQNLIFKLEYHYHYWSKRPEATGSTGMMSMTSNGPKENSMVRAAAIFSF